MLSKYPMQMNITDDFTVDLTVMEYKRNGDDGYGGSCLLLFVAASLFGGDIYCHVESSSTDQNPNLLPNLTKSAPRRSVVVAYANVKNNKGKD